MVTLQVIAGGLLILMGGFIITMNWIVIFQWLRRKKHSSWIPVVGGGLTAAGAAIVPYPPVNTFWWVPLFVDWGCIPSVAYTITFYFLRLFTRKGNGMK